MVEWSPVFKLLDWSFSALIALVLLTKVTPALHAVELQVARLVLLVQGTRGSRDSEGHVYRRRYDDERRGAVE